MCRHCAHIAVAVAVGVCVQKVTLGATICTLGVAVAVGVPVLGTVAVAVATARIRATSGPASGATLSTRTWQFPAGGVTGVPLTA